MQSRNARFTRVIHRGAQQKSKAVRWLQGELAVEDQHGMAEIVRVFHATTHEGKADEFRDFFVDVALPLVKSFRGLVSATVGLPLEATPNSFLMISTWSSIAGLKEFAGENWTEAVIDPREKHLLSAVSVFHYGHLTE